MSIIDKLHEIAEDRGGKCLSVDYTSSTMKLLWECSKGHKWEAAPAFVKRGTWCPDCAGKRKRTIEEMHQLAEDRGGKCLSDTYKDGNTKLLWECSEGHRWEAPSFRVRLTGSWCPVCARVARRSSTWLTIKDMQDLASKRGGRCLSEHYKGSREKLLWECSKGHKWEALHSGIRRGSWCPNCASNSRHSIEYMQSIAEKCGGKCLSDTYKNNTTKLTWECSEGHQWEAMPMKVLSGNWCPKCHIAKRSKHPRQEQSK